MATGDITALRIHSYGDRCEVDVSGFAVGGTFKNGLHDSYGGTGNVPVVASPGSPFYTPYAIVETPGYTEAGVATTYLRKIYFTARQRKAYPNDAQWEEEVVSSTLTFRTFLSEFIYVGDVVRELHLSTDWYKNGGTTSNNELNLTGLTGSGAYVNQSTLAYPVPIANWTRPDRTRLSSYSVTVGAIAFSPLGGKNGKPVAAIKFTATNGTQTASVLVSTFTKTTPPAGTPAADAKCVGEYIGTIDLTGFTDNTLVTVSMEVFPWRGATKYNNSGGAGVNQWSPPQTYLLDVAGTRGYPIAVVDSSIGTSGGVIGASDTSGNRSTCEATPFDTVANAQIALSAWFNTNKGVTRIAGSTIYIKSNSSLAVGGASSIPINAGDTPVTVKPFPGSTPIIPTGTTPTIRGRYVRLEGLTFSRSADGAFIDAATTIEIVAHRCEFADTRGTSQTDSFLTNYYQTWMSECKLTKLSSPGNYVLWRQCDLVDCGQMGRWHLVVGCRYTRLTAATADVHVAMGGGQLSYGSIAFNNEINDAGLGCYSYPGNDGSVGSPVLVYHGCAIVQCLIIHKTGSASGARLIRMAADTSYNETHDCVIAHNTPIGNNSNVFYQDTPQSRKPHYGHALHYNAIESCAAKTDTFANDGDCTGNWPVHFGVNRIGQRVCGGNFPVSFNGVHSRAGHGEPVDGTYLTLHVINDTSASALSPFSPGTGSDGDFHPTQAGSNFKGIIMDLCHVGWDLNGENRFFDGTRHVDAAGCYRYRRDTYVPYGLSGSRLTPANWLLAEDFEGTGTPSGWTNPTGTAGVNYNFDETTDKIEGTQSLKVIGANTGTFRFARIPLTTFPDVWMAYWQMKMTAVPTGGNGRIMEVLRASDSAIQNTAQITQTVFEIKVGNSTGVSGSPQATYALTVGTVYHFWIKRMGTGELQAWINTTGAFPGGVGQFTGSNTTNPGPAGYISLGAARNLGIVFDHLRISGTDIGSFPT